jgi:DNA-binding MarR family transcriptional regulator
MGDPDKAGPARAQRTAAVRAQRAAVVRSKGAAHPPGHIIWDRPGYLVRRLHQIHVAMFLGKVAEGKVTPIQYGLLSILVRRPNIDQLTIGEELGLDRANVADILKRLEARKLVARVVDPENRRRKLCLATARGAELVRRHHADMQASQFQLLAPLAPAEQEIFMGLLSLLVEGNNASGRTSLSDRPCTEIACAAAADAPAPRKRRAPS